MPMTTLKGRVDEEVASVNAKPGPGTVIANKGKILF